MKNILSKITVGLLIGTLSVSCSKFEEINTSPTGSD
ncbi:Uncharacterised protein [Sphingobacterium daejeonense]|nr:Uncharacterised protein [Sphingobacterium daejeonense]